MLADDKTPGRPGRLCAGLYHTDRHPSDAQCTLRCPLPGSASAAGQSRGFHPTMTRPGAQSWPCCAGTGTASQIIPPADSTHQLEHACETVSQAGASPLAQFTANQATLTLFGTALFRWMVNDPDDPVTSVTPCT